MTDICIRSKMYGWPGITFGLAPLPFKSIHKCVYIGNILPVQMYIHRPINGTKAPLNS